VAVARAVARVAVAWAAGTEVDWEAEAAVHDPVGKAVGTVVVLKAVARVGVVSAATKMSALRATR
jgi:hypothetical protein